MAQLYAAEMASRKALMEKSRLVEEAEEARQRKAEHDEDVQTKKTAVREKNRELHRLENRIMKEVSRERTWPCFV